jgi:hypothetical protein
MEKTGDTHNLEIPDSRLRSFLTHAVNTPSPPSGAWEWQINCKRPPTSP